MQARLAGRNGVLLCAVLASAYASHVAADPASQKASRVRETPVLSSQPSFEYAQCANACQLEQDRVVTQCLTADNPKKPRGTPPADCDDNGMAEYLICLKQCPDAASPG